MLLTANVPDLELDEIVFYYAPDIIVRLIPLQEFGFTIGDDFSLKKPSSPYWSIKRTTGSPFYYDCNLYNPIYIISYKKIMILSLKVTVCRWFTKYEDQWSHPNIHDIINLWSILDKKMDDDLLGYIQQFV